MNLDSFVHHFALIETRYILAQFVNCVTYETS